MMSTWMLYSIGTTALLGGTALALERALLGSGRPVRWVWLAAVLASAAVPLALPGLPERGEPGPADAAVGVGEPLVVAAGAPASAPAAPAERALAVGWMLASGALLAGFLGSAALLGRRRSNWRRRVVGGTAVLVSDDTGPAVVGFLWPEVVVPAWVLDWDAGSQRLLVEHEREHERAGDQHLLLVAVLALIALPWNLPLWWQVRRLRLAMEVDCDARVLRRQPTPRAYGLLLLEVGQRASGVRVPAAAFSESGSLLERRIRILAGHHRRPGRAALLALWMVALLAPAAVYAIPAPHRPALAEALRAPRASARAASTARLPPVVAGDTLPDALGREPTFTPYEVKPELRNRAEFARALESAYPPMLRDAGIGGTVVLWVFIDGSGAVKNTRVERSSGYEQLDQAAQRAMLEARFSPARHQGEPVAVWIQLPVSFRTGSAPAREPVDTVPIWRSGLGDPPPGTAPEPTPYTDPPQVLDRAAMARALEQAYPPMLRDAGIGGTAVLGVRIDQTGAVRDTRLTRSSGHAELDAAAERVLRDVRFHPARHRGEPVPVWIQLPVTFRSQQPSGPA